MKTCDEMVNSLLERREQYAMTQKKKKRVLVSTVTSVCVVAMVGVAVWKMPSVTEQPPLVSQDTNAPQVSTDATQNTQPTNTSKPTYHILWADSHDNDAEGWTTYQGRECCFCLYEVLKDHPADKIAIRVEGGISEDFLYNGKTIEEYREAYDQERWLFQKLSTLIKEGEVLKYGDAVYTTGTPDGEGMAKEFYEERLAWYGEELLSRYIVDGEFLKEELEAEVERRLNGYHPARDAEEEALEAGKKQAIAELKPILDSLGLDYEEQIDAGELVFFATADEFVALPKDAVCGTCHWAARGNGSDDLFCDYE